MHVAKSCFLMMALAVGMASCSDPKAPTEANFKKALESDMVEHPLCRQDVFGTEKVGAPVTWKTFGDISRFEEALRKAGVIDVKTTVVNASTHEHIATILKADAWTEGEGFCLGAGVVEKIIHWTEPSSRDGMTVSMVTYKPRFVPAKWVTKDIFDAAGVETPETSDALLYRMNDGWSTRR